MPNATSTLTIIGIDIYPFDIPMHKPFTIATMSTSVSPNMLVRIRTDEPDLYGWGEASPLHSITGETQAICISAAREIAPLMIGKNPLEIASLSLQMDRFLPRNTTTKSAFDIALYDIAAKAAGLPLYRFLGGSNVPMETDMTIGIGDPSAAGAEALSLLEMGFRTIKVKLGTTGKEDYARLHNIRQAVGPDIQLRIDANQAWDRSAAILALRAFEQFDIQFCEQPLRAFDVAGLAEVGRTTSIPIMADEALFSPADAIRLCAENAAPYFNIKLAKSGGIHPALQISAIAQATNRPCMVGCMLESRLGLTASAHLAAACPMARYYDIDSCFEHSVDLIQGGIQIQNGMITLPDEPGIGAEPTAEALTNLTRVEI